MCANVTELPALTQATCSYALLLIILPTFAIKDSCLPKVFLFHVLCQNVHARMRIQIHACPIIDSLNLRAFSHIFLHSTTGIVDTSG